MLRFKNLSECFLYGDFHWKVNESFIKACRDGDLAKFADLVDRADVNYVSESGQSHSNSNPLFLPF